MGTTAALITRMRAARESSSPGEAITHDGQMLSLGKLCSGVLSLGFSDACLISCRTTVGQVVRLFMDVVDDVATLIG